MCGRFLLIFERAKFDNLKDDFNKAVLGRDFLLKLISYLNRKKLVRASITGSRYCRQVMARLVDARVPLTPLGHRAGLKFCESYGDWRRAMVLMEDMRVAKHRPSGERNGRLSDLAGRFFVVVVSKFNQQVLQ